MFCVFIFEPTMKCSSKMAVDDEISLLTRVSTPSKATHKSWSLQVAELEEGGNKGDDKEVEIPCVRFMPPEGGIPSPQLKCFEDKSPTIHKVSVEGTQSDAAQPQLNLSLDASQMSVRSTDTTLEYFDAPLSGEQEGEEDGVTAAKDENVVTINITVQAETGEPEKTSPTSEEIPLMTSEDVEREEVEEAKEEEISEVLETGLEQETTNEEMVPPEMLHEQDPDLSTRQDATLADQGNASENIQGNSFQEFFIFNCQRFVSLQVVITMWYREVQKRDLTQLHLETVCNQVTEDADCNSEVRLEDEPVPTAGQDILLETTEATGFLEHLNSIEATEPTKEEELEQTGPSLLIH